MLPKHMRFVFMNKTGVSIPFNSDAPNNSFVINMLGKKMVDGNLAYGTEFVAFPTPTVDVADGTSVVSATIVDNETNVFLGADFIAIFKTNVAVDSRIEIRKEVSTDGGVTWPSNRPDYNPQTDLVLVRTMNTGAGAGERALNFDM